MESKELPDDVLSIISDYSKPAFVYFREYNEALSHFDLTPDYKEKLKTKIDDPFIRDQLEICIEARLDYRNKDAIYHADNTRLNEEILDKSKWWDCVSLEKLAALLDDKEYRMRGYAEWYFQDEINDAWMDSDSDDDSVRREEEQQRQEEWMLGLDNEGEESDTD
jgi:hypothetical protein